MCLQQYSHMSCGHIRLQQNLCDDARALDLPLFNVLMCPDYQLESKDDVNQCGIGGYYCAEDADGPLIDGFHRTLSAAEAYFESSVRKIDEVRIKEYDVLRYVRSVTSTVDDFNHHPAIENIWRVAQPLFRARDSASATKAHVTQMIAISRAYLAFRQNNPSAPPMSQNHNMYRQSPLAGPPPSSPTSPSDWYDNLQGTIPQTSRHPRETMQASGLNYPTWPAATATTTAYNNNARQEASKPAKCTQTPPNRATARHPASTAHRVTKGQYLSPQIPPSVRRSARVSERRVNYAESSPSAPTSREPSMERVDSRLSTLQSTEPDLATGYASSGQFPALDQSQTSSFPYDPFNESGVNVRNAWHASAMPPFIPPTDVLTHEDIAAFRRSQASLKYESPNERDAWNAWVARALHLDK